MEKVKTDEIRNVYENHHEIWYTMYFVKCGKPVIYRKCCTFYMRGHAYYIIYCQHKKHNKKGWKKIPYM